MLINTEKTQLMLISSRQKRNSLIDSDLKITFNDIDLKISSNEKNFDIIAPLVIIADSNISLCSTDFCTTMHILNHILNIVV